MRLPAWVSATETRVRKRTDAVQTWVERTIWWRVWERVLENEFVDRAVALAAKAFVSLFPAIIVIAAFAPASVRDSIYRTITHRAGLSGAGLATVRGAFASADDIRRATGILGLVFTFFYINSFTTALQRVYTRAWRRPPAAGRVSGYALGASWLVGILVYLVIIGVARAIIGSGPELAAYAVVAVAAAIALWCITPWLMLGRQVRLRVLVPTGAITGIAMSVYAASASLWIPRTVTENQHQFGFFGVALSLVTWLSGMALIIVVSAAAGPVLAEDTGWIGERVRGSAASGTLAPDAAPSLPPPASAPTLSDALGRGSQDDPEL
jgi:membrane protein